MTVKVKWKVFPTIHELETLIHIVQTPDEVILVPTSSFIPRHTSHDNFVPVLLFEAFNGRVRCLR